MHQRQAATDGDVCGQMLVHADPLPTALVIQIQWLYSERDCMTGIAFDQILSKAKEQWPTVQWEPEAFRTHLTHEDDQTSPRFATDLYLAGAAGFRVGQAWAAIESELGPEARRILTRQPIADCTVDDLWSEAVVKLMANDQQHALLPDGQTAAKIIRYRGKIRLLFYIVVIAKRHAINRNRISHRKRSLTRSQADEAIDMPVISQEIQPDVSVASSEIAAGLRMKLRSAVESLSVEQRFLIAMVYRNGMMQKEAGAMLGFSEFKTSRQLKEAMERLRDQLISVYDNQWTPALEAAWVGCWAESWSDVQVPSHHVSTDTEKKDHNND